MEVHPLTYPECLISHDETICFRLFKSYREEVHHISRSLANSWGFFRLYCSGVVCPWTSHCGEERGHILMTKPIKIYFQSWGWSQCHETTWGKMMRRHVLLWEIQSTVTRRQREMNAGQPTAGVSSQLFSVLLSGLNVLMNVKHLTLWLAHRKCPVNMSLVF